MANKPISDAEIKAILTSQPKEKGPVTEPRTIENFYRLNHILDQHGCSNPNCVDPRPREDMGRKIVVAVSTPQGEKRICRHCFLQKYLSPNADVS